MEKKLAILLLGLFSSSVANARPRLFVNHFALSLQGEERGEGPTDFSKQIRLLSGGTTLGVEERFGRFSLRVWVGAQETDLQVHLAQAGQPAKKAMDLSLFLNYHTAVSGVGAGWRGEDFRFDLTVQAELLRPRQEIGLQAISFGEFEATELARNSAKMHCDVVGATASLSGARRLTEWWELEVAVSLRFFSAQCGLTLTPSAERLVEALRVDIGQLRHQELVLLLPSVGIGSTFRVGKFVSLRLRGEVTAYPSLPLFWTGLATTEFTIPLRRADWRWGW